MSTGSDAIDSENSPVLVLPYPHDLLTSTHTKVATRAEFLAKIREALALGKMILIKGWNPDNHVQFNEDEVRSWRGTLAQTVQWQGNSRCFISLLFFH